MKFLQLLPWRRKKIAPEIKERNITKYLHRYLKKNMKEAYDKKSVADSCKEQDVLILIDNDFYILEYKFYIPLDCKIRMKDIKLSRIISLKAKDLIGLFNNNVLIIGE